MKRWKKVLIKPKASISKAIQIIDVSSLQIALVVDEELHLLGTVTDGDIRRAILKGISLEKEVACVMNQKPFTVGQLHSQEETLEIMRKNQFRHIPIIDDNKKLVGLETLDDLLQPSEKLNWVVLMAGGLGQRMAPMTDNCPKPLLAIGNKPVLETIIGNFSNYGFRRFYISLNYKAEMIRDYFGDGKKWGVEILYLIEDKKLGTAGALSLLPSNPPGPLFIMNSDVLTKVNFEHLLDFHIDNKASGTMCVKEYDFQVPYGVININKEDRIIGIDEKPVQKLFVNAGIYVLESNILNEIPSDQYFDMPSLFENLISKKQNTIAFPIREYWLDIGKLDDFEKAKGEYTGVFG